MRWWEVAQIAFNAGLFVGWYLERKRRDADSFRLGVACSRVMGPELFDRLTKEIEAVDDEAAAKRPWWRPW
jgi:hypothetical protein